MSHLRGAAALLSAYLLGGIPFAHLFTHWITGEDIRELGNRNAGAANVFRAVSHPAGAIVAALDIGKGGAGVGLMHLVGLTGLWPLAGGVAAVIGHNFPVYLRFRGGRGLATSLGALLALMPLETALVLPILGVIYLLLTGSAVTGATVSFLCLVGLAAWRGHPWYNVLAPLIFLLLMGIRWIPQELQALQHASDTKALLTRDLLRTRYTPDGKPED